MSKETTLNRLHDLGIVAVIRGPSPELTVRMVEALVAGGICGIEITYTTPHAIEVVEALDRTFGDGILLGMGTLTDPVQAAEAQAAGARYLVSPITDEALGRAMVATGLPVMIGALTPTEVWHAHQLGSDVVKLFPGSAVGPDYVKALHGPFPDIKIMPTGGVDEHNLSDWFRAGVWAVGAGSQLSPAKLARAGRFDEITAVAARFAAAVKKLRMTNDE
ncbi:MAG: bifunctional 4-hydroxy-2-oxoglutarate aldolase/2-dehydro-3-deoxy-phosphogluconate aldolase [Anaerolineae bacterium]|uniref:bifunctional 4-hydroxy-2-oxoglutarate aldolase/2-dehydro-3-deoxy-phosphogluconate aldolase n=1 Tax=Promineifilum sp. TaxID=2664178 RepID=UPI001D2B3830|nr:bifunctional 4-hydroxy-2-oxoglutarate aldolase/2-dehydro-3-deoxy-phosphogluconate aldolase [Anaerolineales bacterium]MCB8935823.1 bifunctional 4-hydroxy-2-oxoglutarate aldolase/2-dehydro-3-deoxy-phosphogluconate aldolase [Promineifilum sp.]MCO5180446.1 bifunctional 4-hydroxy-2-oxoglutarate aldolase/2-dehydro-3-deoxy-phosphogluconate aldolase [Promineifilum sp.]MCW5847398.1 bifunctional 4-hydroxy-2-oxoglutarate aldolase/2-dehydro-3-deoxy-phosphogluconate aldolase [Anaerolineae bacterium]